MTKNKINTKRSSLPTDITMLLMKGTLILGVFEGDNPGIAEYAKFFGHQQGNSETHKAD